MNIKLKFNNDFLSLLELKKKKYDKESVIVRLLDLLYKNDQLDNENFCYKLDHSFKKKLNNLLRYNKKNHILVDIENYNNKFFTNNNQTYFESGSYLVNNTSFFDMSDNIINQFDMSDNNINQFDMIDNNITTGTILSDSQINTSQNILYVPYILRKDKVNSNETIRFYTAHKNMKIITSLFIEKSYNHNIYDEGNKIKKLIL